jgi:hypothetical protein
MEMSIVESEVSHGCAHMFRDNAPSLAVTNALSFDAFCQAPANGAKPVR